MLALTQELIGGLFAAALALVLLLFTRRRKRRQQLCSAPFPALWERWLQQNLPVYKGLPPQLKKRLKQRIRQFLAEKNIEGCGGLEIDDEIRLTIAAQACLLRIGRPHGCYPQLQSVLVYPSAFTPRSGLFHRSQTNAPHLGQSWHHGTVVLAWDSVQRGAANFADGVNVAIHEFAHQLDQQSGTANGAPLLESKAAYATWAEVMQAEYDVLNERAGKRKSLFDDYGATHPAEFFAVVSEVFFEKPRAMKKDHPELYHELRRYYRLDPQRWR